MATVRMPSSCAERKTRIAISPRLATSSLRISAMNPPNACSVVPTSGCPLAMTLVALGDHRILEPADPVDRRDDEVSGLEVRPRSRADARGGAGGDDVSRLQGDE